jgi:hypothetical protein
MYGLVNQGMRDLVVERFGEATWKKICARAEWNDEGFTLMQSYPDSLTYRLVGAACAELSVEAGPLLEQFGEYWIKFTAEKGYGELLKLFGADFKSCLKNLNHMHARMGAMMPDLQPPRFSVEEESASRLRLKYFSKREGLAPMVVGLLKGLAGRHGNHIAVEHRPRDQGQDHELFVVDLLN